MWTKGKILSTPEKLSVPNKVEYAYTFQLGIPSSYCEIVVHIHKICSEIVICSYDRIIYSNKEVWITASKINMDESQNDYHGQK